MYDSYNPSFTYDKKDEQNRDTSANGEKFQSSSSGGSHFGDDMFEEFDNFFYSKSSNNSKTKPIRGKDIHNNLHINFIESINGCKKTIKYSRKCQCSICKGNKCRPGTNPTKCYTCGGKGNINYRDGFENVETICEKCEGFGKIIKFPCNNCKGNGFVEEQIEEIVEVPIGVASGQILRKEEKGDHGENFGKKGDLYIKVFVEPDEYFHRDGNDIYTHCSLTISQAVLGTNLLIKTLTGNVEILVEKGTQHGDKKKLVNMGIKKLNNNKHRGNHYVVFNLKVPNNLDEKQYNLYRELSKLEE